MIYEASLRWCLFFIISFFGGFFMIYGTYSLKKSVVPYEGSEMAGRLYALPFIGALPPPPRLRTFSI